MKNDDNDFLNENSGISIEEQKEILTQINGIVEKNRRSLSENIPSDKPDFTAKKNSLIFPLAVNITAVIILTAGILFLTSFNKRTDAQVRAGDAVFDLTERALIDEIRRDTALAIAAKEMEIASIILRLQEVDALLLESQAGSQERQSLLVMQSSYRDELEVLNTERAKILEESRERETRLRAQLDERSRAFAFTQRVNERELESARAELERLTAERERFAAMEALLAGGFSLGDHVNGQSAGSHQPGVQNESGLSEINIQLENTISEMQRTIDAFTSGSSGQERRLGELEDTIASLRNTVSLLETNSTDKDRTISALESERTDLNRTISQLQTSNSAQELRIVELNNQLAAIRVLLQDSQ
jgi:DNA repair exonuclease SbcCD ATPase subunit